MEDLGVCHSDPLRDPAQMWCRHLPILRSSASTSVEGMASSEVTSSFWRQPMFGGWAKWAYKCLILAIVPNMRKLCQTLLAESSLPHGTSSSLCPGLPAPLSLLVVDS